MIKKITKIITAILPAAALMLLPLSSHAQFFTGENLNPETFYYNGTNLCNVVETGSPYYMAYCLGQPGAIQKLGNYNDNIISDGACSVAEPGSAYFYRNCLDDILGVHGFGTLNDSFVPLGNINSSYYNKAGTYSAPVYTPPVNKTPTCGTTCNTPAPTTYNTPTCSTSCNTPTYTPTPTNNYSTSGYYASPYPYSSNFDFSGNNNFGSYHNEGFGSFYDNVGFLANNGGLANFGLDFPRTGLSGINNYNPGFIYSGVDFNGPGSLLPNFFGNTYGAYNPYLGLY